MSIDLARNGQVFHYLKKWGQKENQRGGYSVGGYEVCVHPDLVDRLRQLAIATPKANFEYLFGTPVLTTLEGKIFASASGTSSLALYLPNNMTWGRRYEEFGEGWRQGSAWPKDLGHIPSADEMLSALLGEAYSSASEGRS